jgi:beta-galactosidase
VRLGYGSRQAFCPSSADYRRAAARLTREIASRFSQHPAVAMWHVHNEYGCHNLPCYCDASGAAFQRWLEKKYSSIDVLNDAWGTAFWSQGYSSFAEITPPRVSGTFINPTQQLDFARFSSDELLECFDAEAAILREFSTLEITTNFMGFLMGLDRPLDYWEWSEHQDIVSNDHYLIASDPRGFQELAMVDDFIRGLSGGEPWMLMEHSTSAVNWQPRNRAKAPGELLRNSIQHVARGADAVLFFQWRAAKAGSEKFHSAMLPHAGTDTKIWREVVQLGAALGSLSEVVGSRVADTRVALIHDTDARWASQLDAHPTIDTDMMAETRRWHDALYRLGVTTDFRRSTDDLSDYALVVVPMTYLVTDRAVENIRDYVLAGGHVVVTYFSGIVDENDHVRLGGYPGAFRDLLGIRLEEFYPLGEQESISLTTFGTGTIFSDLGRAEDAEVLAAYSTGATAGSPAITRNAVGAGAAYYVGTSLTPTGLRDLLSGVLASAGATPKLVPAADVEVVRRTDGSTSWLFVINHSLVDTHVAARGVELIENVDVTGTLVVPAGSVAVVREDKESRS